jgi:ABC-type antimicrobial peptide transport system permease subunit
MSIKERYREIATLKCLGAINPYIRQLFVIESLLQGAVGSFLGVVFGTVLYGFAAETMATALWIVQVNVVCIVVGVIMTMAAAVWPIHEALAMMPIEALRVEE